MSYAKYRALIQLPYPTAAGSDASATQAAALDMPSTEAAADLVHSSDGGVEGNAQSHALGLLPKYNQRGNWKPEGAPPEGFGASKDEPAGVESCPSEALSYEEEIAQLEALLQGHRDFDESGRDITDVRLIHADPPPAFLRRTG